MLDGDAFDLAFELAMRSYRYVTDLAEAWEAESLVLLDDLEPSPVKGECLEMALGFEPQLTGPHPSERESGST